MSHSKLPGDIHMSVPGLEQHAYWAIGIVRGASKVESASHTISYRTDGTSDSANTVTRMKFLKLFLVPWHTIVRGALLLVGCRRRFMLEVTTGQPGELIAEEVE
jgi:hypothetical protein